ncbi:hypothetical protein FK85_14415 [Halorubrum saccharovorum]|uniref:Uncharacterized protein n=1 Tax=Halorubrum saccharovorum TaxID=2248 RepID=A0A081EXY8_9EURY|nr:hypothetical protein FK85_14415 [Halorubrum saccharovorum]
MLLRTFLPSTGPFTGVLEFTVGRCKHVIHDTERNDESRQPESPEAGVSPYIYEDDQPGHPNSDPDPDSQLPSIFTPPDEDTSTQQHDTTHNRINTERQPTEGEPTQYQSDPDPPKLFDRIEVVLTHTRHFIT